MLALLKSWKKKVIGFANRGLVTISVLNGEKFIRINKEKLLQIVYPLRSQFPVKTLTKKLLLVFLLAQVFFL